ncbi:GNAT family N-acetyltransferase [Fructilactobacillus florum]|uniref:N-acetyltransferase domain-containing protein n=1 Tax=Fructilactobacillus florum DSM 22689 = JCM 16035 TaxID=1423745 RepID=A0A0R2CLJ8_9LACO|nr:GNAT family N-acetyltransferase [Fructilactobacillus florum]KRM92509.1 hypothetical protein FC87_GL000121 [Fructilactobacillus florum DSM 22689 = JCM 16035]
MSEVTLRAADANDAVAVLSLLKQLTAETSQFRVANLNQSVAQLAADLQTIKYSSRAVLIVAKCSDQFVGLVSIVATTPTSGELGIAVRAVDQQLGIGTALMATALDWFFSQSMLTSVWLEVYRSNQTARHLYEKFGFQITQSTPTTVVMQIKKRSSGNQAKKVR